jgi:hypothetical protein
LAETGSYRLFEDYLKEMEDFLDREANTIRDKRLQFLAKENNMSVSDIEKMDDVQFSVINFTSEMAYDPEFSGLSDYDHYFPMIFRQSLFLALYADCEKYLNYQCQELQRMRNFSLSLKDLSGNGIIRARNYLTKVAQVNFPDGKEWQEIQSYGKLRNCFAHNDGELTGLSESDAKFLKEYASKNPYLEVKEATVVFIEIKKGFCEEAIKVFDAFTVKLIRSCVEKRFET